MSSVAGMSAIEKLPNEILAAVLAPHLVVNKSYALTSHEANKEIVARDDKIISAHGLKGLNYRTLTNLSWFKQAVWFKDELLKPVWMTADLNPTPLEVSKRFASVGTHLLSRSNGFFEVATSSNFFENDARIFGFKTWQLDEISTRPDAALKILMKQNCHIAGPETLQGHRSTSHYLLDTNELEDFGRFLTLQGARGLRDYTGVFLRILVARDVVPAFCTAGEIFEKMLLGPFLVGLSHSISTIEFTNGVQSRMQLKKRLQHHKELIKRFGGLPNVNFFSVAAFLHNLTGQYQLRMADNVEGAGDILRRMIQIAVTVLRSKLGAFGYIDDMTAIHLPQVRFILEVLRVSAFKMAQHQLGLLVSAFRNGDIYRTFALHALHCFGYALACPPLNLTSGQQSGWKAQCYAEMFMVHLILDQTEEAWKCVECIGLLGVWPDPDKTQEQVDFHEEVKAEQWRVSVTRAKESYIAGVVDGSSKWRRLPFRVAFGSKFGREKLEPWHQCKWPSKDSVIFPDLAHFVYDLEPE